MSLELKNLLNFDSFCDNLAALGGVADPRHVQCSANTAISLTPVLAERAAAAVQKHTLLARAPPLAVLAEGGAPALNLNSGAMFWKIIRLSGPGMGRCLQKSAPRPIKRSESDYLMMKSHPN